MKRLPVESSSLASVGYDATSRVLEVEFRHGAVYRYRDVPPETSAALLSAESKGRFLNEEIRSLYECLKVR